MIYQARTEANEILIAMYETEEPTRTGFVNVSQATTPENFEILHKKWQSSKREYKMRESDKEAIKQELLGEVPFMLSDIETELEKGIDCTFLKNRLKLVTVWEHNTDRNVPAKEDLVEYWTLLPLEDKKENDKEQLINEYFDGLIQIDKDLQGKHPHSQMIYDMSIANINQLNRIREMMLLIFKNPNKQ